MTTLKDLIEALEVAPKRHDSKPVEVFMGRMQPIHKGHAESIKGLKNGVVVLVKGEKSSTDASKNPLSQDQQIKLIKKAVGPKIKIVVSSTGYLPAIFSDLRSMGYEPTKLVAGPDRVAKYKGMIDGFNKNIEPEKQFDVKIEGTPRRENISATDVRNAIRAGDEETFKKMMPKELWSEFEYLRGIVEEVLHEQHTMMTLGAISKNKLNLTLSRILKPRVFRDVPFAEIASEFAHQGLVITDKEGFEIFNHVLPLPTSRDTNIRAYLALKASKNNSRYSVYDNAEIIIHVSNVVGGVEVIGHIV